jgi:hypothetical protein
MMVRSARLRTGFFIAVLLSPSFLFTPAALADDDTTRPVIVSISPASGTVFGPGVVQFVVQAYDDNPGQLTLTFGDEDVVTPAPPYDAPGSPVASNMNATLTVDTNTIPDGGYILHVRAKDVAGNVAEQSARYIVDKQAPSVPTAGMPNAAQRQTNDVSFAWQASSDSMSPTDIRYDFRAARSSDDLNGDAVVKLSSLESNAVTVDSLDEGVWYWQVRAIDKAGNESGWSEAWSVLIDGNAPQLEIHAPLEGQLFGGKNTMLNVAVDASDANGLQEYGVLLDGVAVEKVIQPANGSMMPVAVNIADRDDGEHVVVAYAIDGAGNRAEVVRTVLLDTVGPDVLTTLSNNSVIKGITSLVMESSDIHPGQHDIIIRNADGIIVSEGTPEYMTDSSWRYAWDTTEVVDGIYTIQFRSIDAAGNETILSRAVTVKNEIALGMGTALPSVPLVTPLEVELSQPRLLGIVTPSTEGRGAIGGEAANDVINTPSESIRQPDAISIQSTEGGWKLFGIMWYWWALFGSGTGVVAWQGWRFAQSRLRDGV